MKVLKLKSLQLQAGAKSWKFRAPNIRRESLETKSLQFHIGQSSTKSFETKSLQFRAHETSWAKSWQFKPEKFYAQISL